eukprot:scaffold1637_cov410-Prasinococcus_capsulatus_cf.AAC.6
MPQRYPGTPTLSPLEAPYAILSLHWPGDPTGRVRHILLGQPDRPDENGHAQLHQGTAVSSTGVTSAALSLAAAVSSTGVTPAALSLAATA